MSTDPSEVNPSPTVTDAPPSVVLTEIPMSGQPATDKAYTTPEGTKMRARVIVMPTVTTSKAPTNGDVQVAPTSINLSVTLAVLNDDMTVKTDANGAFLISDVHELVWADSAHANDSFDPAADLLAVLEQQAAALETRMSKRAAVSDVLAQWGTTPEAADPTSSLPPLSPATSSTTVAEMIADAAKVLADAQTAKAVADAQAQSQADAADAAAKAAAQAEADKQAAVDAAVAAAKAEPAPEPAAWAPSPGLPADGTPAQ